MSNHSTREFRIQWFCDSFNEARELAASAGWELRQPDLWHYQLRVHPDGFIYNLYPNKRGSRARCYSDPNKRGPFVELPAVWNLTDFVLSALVEIKGVSRIYTNDASCRLCGDFDLLASSQSGFCRNCFGMMTE